MATPSLDLCRGEGKEPNSLRSDKAPSFFLPATKIQGAIKGRNVNGHTDGVLGYVALVCCCCCSLCFALCWWCLLR
ncbi:hypothetical protein R20233_00902 [Ralstonia sp. LMG 32965]|nr:hypothetical protein R20233_00902 [Ralstonia sp. LMG 32965]